MEKPDTSEEVDQAFWYLLPAATPDHELKKLVKANTTLSYIVQGTYLISFMRSFPLCRPIFYP